MCALPAVPLSPCPRNNSNSHAKVGAATSRAFFEGTFVVPREVAVRGRGEGLLSLVGGLGGLGGLGGQQITIGPVYRERRATTSFGAEDVKPALFSLMQRAIYASNATPYAKAHHATPHTQLKQLSI